VAKPGQLLGKEIVKRVVRDAVAEQCSHMDANVQKFMRRELKPQVQDALASYLSDAQDLGFNVQKFFVTKLATEVQRNTDTDPHNLP
jgi:hypothetical protein